MKFCCSLAFTDTRHYLELARVADTCGWDTFLLSDHLVHPEKIAAKYPYNETGERPWAASADWPDVWVATGAMAAVTERLRFLQGVYVLPMRDPFHVAKAVGTAAVLSGGRVGLGIGMGWMKDEFDLLGAGFAGRGARAEEMLEVMRKLWSGEMVEHHGRHFDFDRLNMRPPVREKIPVVIGGSSEVALRRVARLGDGWCAHLLPEDELAACIERIRAHRRECGRDGEPLAVYAPSAEARDADGYRRLEQIGVTHAMVIPWILYGGSAASLDAKRAGLERFAEEVIARV